MTDLEIFEIDSTTKNISVLLSEISNKRVKYKKELEQVWGEWQSNNKLDDWLEKYDDIFFDQYQSIISQYNNLECVLWKNFCKINSKKQERNFKIVDKTWIQYSASILGTTLQAPSFYSVGWLDSIINDSNYKAVKFDKSLLLKELDIIEQSNNFIKGNPLHSHHPNEFSHLLWAQYLIRKAGWKNDI